MPAIQVVWVDSHESVEFLHLMVDSYVAVIEEREKTAVLQLHTKKKIV